MKVKEDDCNMETSWEGCKWHMAYKEAFHSSYTCPQERM